jgi:hypothetical protein
MQKDSRFVGLDVHAETIAVAVAERGGAGRHSQPHGRVLPAGASFALRAAGQGIRRPRGRSRLPVPGTQ